MGVSSFSEKVGGINFEFWWGFYFSTRHPNFTSNRYSVPSGSRPDLHSARPKAEFDGTGWTGGTGETDGPEKCPLNFFKLCGYLELVYI